MRYARRIVYGISIVWFLTLYIYVASTVPVEHAAIATLMRFFGLTALCLLYIVLTPGLLRAFFPEAVFVPKFIYMRRAFGVSLFFFALLHGLIGFLYNLEGSLRTIFALSVTYQAGFIASAIAFCILAVMALTSFDYMVRILGGARWKNLHRLIYVAALLVLVHAFLIGSHFTNQDGLIPVLIRWTSLVYIFLELAATAKYLNQKPSRHTPWIMMLLVMLGCSALFVALNLGGSGIFNIHGDHVQHYDK